MTILSVGEVLWDVIGDREYLGGAPFNLAAHAARLGHRVLFVSAVGDDERGRRALAQAEELGVSTRFLETAAGQATGVVTVTMEGTGHRFTIHRPAAYDCVRLDEDTLAQLVAEQPAWICYGTLFAMHPNSLGVLRRILDALPAARRLYDINLRPDSYTPGLVGELMARAELAKLNDSEVEAVDGMFGRRHESLEAFARDWSARLGWRGVCITRGEKGCALLLGDEYVEVAGYPVQVADTVGAGDAFAAAFMHGLACGWGLDQVGRFANRVGALVASQPGAVPAGLTY